MSGNRLNDLVYREPPPSIQVRWIYTYGSARDSFGGNFDTLAEALAECQKYADRKYKQPSLVWTLRTILEDNQICSFYTASHKGVEYVAYPDTMKNSPWYLMEME